MFSLFASDQERAFDNNIVLYASKKNEWNSVESNETAMPLGGGQGTPRKIGWGHMQSASQNSYPIGDQNLRFFRLPCLRPEPKIWYP